MIPETAADIAAIIWKSPIIFFCYILLAELFLHYKGCFQMKE